VRYGGVLLSAPLHASVTLHNLLNVPVKFANKMGFKKKKKKKTLISRLSALTGVVLSASASVQFLTLNMK
jgi:hypothetical protein